MTSDLATLEQELRSLGQRELALETLLTTLRARSRAAGLAKRHDVADQAWAMLETYRRELTELQSRIRKIEALIYSQRR